MRHIMDNQETQVIRKDNGGKAMSKFISNEEINNSISRFGLDCDKGLDYVNNYEKTRDLFDGLNQDTQWEVIKIMQYGLVRELNSLINRDRCIAILIATGNLSADFTVFAGYEPD